MATTRKLGEMLVSADRERTVLIDADKVSRGSFFTTDAAWLNTPVRAFLSRALACNDPAHSANSKTKPIVLDPFAGDGHLLDLVSAEFGASVAGFDISGDKWPKNDSLISIPVPKSASGAKPIIVTNPPYLANHSAKRKGVNSLVASYFAANGKGVRQDNLYKIALDRCLEVADFVVAIIPETFLLSNYDKSRLELAVVIESALFGDTDAPAVVACFGPAQVAVGSASVKPATSAQIFIGERNLGELGDILNLRKRGPEPRQRIVFNDPAGRIGFRAVDGSSGQDPIAFVWGDDFQSAYPRESIKVSSRLMTYLDMPNQTDDEVRCTIVHANQLLAEIREKSQDLVLAPFKGNDKNGKRRRRLDYELARTILNHAASC